MLILCTTDISRITDSKYTDTCAHCSTGSTCATDMFAFGKTIKLLEASCNPRDGQQVSMASCLVSSLTAPTPEHRLCASEVLQHAFFAPAKDSLRAQIAECSLCLSSACVAGRVNASLGVTCSLNQHFLCAACVEALVAKAIQQGGDDSAANLSRLSDGKVLYIYEHMKIRQWSGAVYTCIHAYAALPAHIAFALRLYMYKHMHIHRCTAHTALHFSLVCCATTEIRSSQGHYLLLPSIATCMHACDCLRTVKSVSLRLRWSRSSNWYATLGFP
jgi:hypothetical protein